MKKILVIDDNTGILNALRMALTMFGYEVLCIARADELEKNLVSFKPDIIILDLLLSGKSGADICRFLKNSEVWKSIPVIMMSAHPSAEKTIRDAGANAFLAKPFELAYLSELIKTHT